MISQTTIEQSKLFFGQRQSKLFFILGAGRSGTQLVSHLLNRPNQSMVLHEPNYTDDVGTLSDFRLNPEKTIDYWKSFRQHEVYKRWSQDSQARIYGEVSGTIRYHGPAIQKLFPNAKICLITRDGRGFVRFLMGWLAFYNNNSKGAYALEPLPGDPFLKEWPYLTRFDKICWAWQEANEYIMRSVPEDRWIKLENLVSDYEYFSLKLTNYLELNIPHDEWHEGVSYKSPNASNKYFFPAGEDWTSKQKDDFTRICGKTMSRLNYPI